MKKCITAYLMELWVIMFADVGKLYFAFPYAVNLSFPDEIASYALF